MPKISQYPTVPPLLTGKELIPLDMGVPSSPQTVTATSDTVVQFLTPGPHNLGYLNSPLNVQTASYSLQASDANATVVLANGSGACTFTIPSNAAVALPLGTVFSFVNRDPSGLTVAINADTLITAASTTTGSVTVTQNQTATAVKVESTIWLITFGGAAGVAANFTFIAGADAFPPTTIGYLTTGTQGVLLNGHIIEAGNPVALIDILGTNTFEMQTFCDITPGSFTAITIVELAVTKTSASATFTPSCCCINIFDWSGIAGMVAGQTYNVVVT